MAGGRTDEITKEVEDACERRMKEGEDLCAALWGPRETPPRE
jgi:hypothetical protein